jgi:FlaA1/EpsC-like NDP-sugar epimerase
MLLCPLLPGDHILSSDRALGRPPCRVSIRRMFENRFTAKTAVVTGGASGIGKAIVERLAGEGAHVAIFDRDQKALDAVAKQLASFGVEAHGPEQATGS